MVAAAGSECSPDRRTDHLLCSSPPEHPLLWNGPDKRPTSSDTLVTDKSAATVAVATPNAPPACEAVKAQYKSAATFAVATTNKIPASDNPPGAASAYHAVTLDSPISAPASHDDGATAKSSITHGVARDRSTSALAASVNPTFDRRRTRACMPGQATR